MIINKDIDTSLTFLIMDITDFSDGMASGAPSGRSRRLPLITRPPASYGANPRQDPGDCKSRD
jgi:hypothetical protein